MGESAFAVLAVADPVRDRMDGREPVCALAGRIVRGCVPVCWNCLLSSDEETDCPSRARVSAGSIHWKRQEGQGVGVYLHCRNSLILFTAMDRLRLLRHSRDYVAAA